MCFVHLSPSLSSLLSLGKQIEDAPVISSLENICDYFSFPLLIVIDYAVFIAQLFFFFFLPSGSSSMVFILKESEPLTLAISTVPFFGLIYSF